MSQILEESKGRKFSIKDWEKAKKKENSQSKIGRKQKKYAERLWTRQYLNNTELSLSKQQKKGNHDLKWSSPFDCQPKSRALVAYSPHTKQKQERKRPKHSEPNFPPKNPIPKKKSYRSMITHVIFDLIGNDLQNQVMTYLWFGIRMRHLPV